VEAPIAASPSSEDRHALLTIEELFAQRVEASPDAVAVSDRGVDLSYGTLSERADRLSAALAEAGVRQGDFVALCLERGADLITAMVATLRAGAAYVPIDPRYPEDRRDYILEDSGAAALVCSGSAASPTVRSTTTGRPGRPSANPGARIAYVIYTSGSTGKPKGVMVTHHNVLRLFTATAAVFRFSAKDVWCGFHSPSFDFSVWEIWGALLHGARHIVVPSETARDPARFADLLQAEGVTVLNQTPSAFRNLIPILLARGRPAGLRSIIFGGEKLDCAALRPWATHFGLDRPALVNMYGITETTVHVTHKRITVSELDGSDLSPIGSPIRDLCLRIVLPDGSEAPRGTPGVMHVGGDGVTAGYLGRDDLTAQRFYSAADAQGRSMRWYDSGDICVQVSDTEFAYVGRADKQLKIRGYRIEPGEIETALRACPEVIDCVVTAADFASNDRRLVACVILSDAALRSRPQALRRLKFTLEAALPPYMCPSHYFLRREFPMTENGKLDIAACMRQPSDDRAEGSPGASPYALVRGVWTQLLGCEPQSEDDDFFDLGGTSFTLIKMLRAVNAIFDTTVTPDVLSSGATINTLTRAILGQRQSQPA
jgi:amino acid adenylation domain-containing protein